MFLFGCCSAWASVRKPLLHQIHHVGMVEAARQALAIAKMIDARIAAVRPVGAPGLENQQAGGAVRILLAGIAGQADAVMGIANRRLQHVAHGIRAGAVRFEVLPRRMQHLLGRQRAAGMAAHAIGEHRQQRALGLGMGVDGDTILLFLPVADMLGGAGFYGQGHELDYRPAVGNGSRPIYY